MAWFSNPPPGFRSFSDLRWLPKNGRGAPGGNCSLSLWLGPSLSFSAGFLCRALVGGPKRAHALRFVLGLRCLVRFGARKGGSLIEN